MNKTKLFIQLEGDTVKSGIQCEKVTQTGLCQLIAHLEYLKNKIQERFEKGLQVQESEK